MNTLLTDTDLCT